MRYARPEFLDDIASSTPLPMVVDGELGMPLDLSRWDCLWEENGDDSGAWFGFRACPTFNADATGHFPGSS